MLSQFHHPLSAVTLSPEALSGGSIPRKIITPLLWLALLLAAATFIIRGPLRASSDYANDFAAPYTSARLWLQHQNPYDSEAFWPAFHAAGAPTGPTYANPSSTHSIYPPPSVVALSPFALLSWPTAWKILILLSTILYLTALVLLSRLLPGTSNLVSGTCRFAFLILGLLLAPALSALHVSNVTILSVSLLLIALYLLLRPYNCGTTSEPGAPSSARTSRLRWASSEARPPSSTLAQPYMEAINLGGPSFPVSSERVGCLPIPITSTLGSSTSLFIAFLLSLSISIKPTLAPIIILYLLYKRLWKILIPTITLTTLITITFQLLQPNWNWLPSLRSNIELLFTTGVASLLPQNLTRSDRIDLQLPAYALTHNLTAAAILATLIAIAILVRMSLGVPHNRRNAPIVGVVSPTTQAPYQTPGQHLDQNLLTLSTLLVIGLLPFYQRFYSATLLLLPILWALRNITLTRARWTLALCCVFLVNTSVLPRRLGLHAPPTGPIHLLVDALLVPHLNWLLLALAILLLNANRRIPENRT